MAYVYIYPPHDTQNDFIIDQMAQWKQQGYDVTDSLRDFRKTEWFVLNWYENVYVGSRLTYLKKLVFLWCLVLFGKKIAVYVHNRRPHAKYGAVPDYALSERLLIHLIRRAEKVVVLTDTAVRYFDGVVRKALLAAQAKTICVPHPHFDDLYTVSSAPIQDGRIRLLVFGQIEQYKGVEVAVQAMNRLERQDVEMHIVGSCKKEQQTILRGMSINPNTHFRFEYVKNADLAALFSPFDYAVFPLDTNSCLNSSSVLLARSLCTPVVCPHIATLDDLTEQAYVSYCYTTKEDHIDVLVGVLESLNKR